MSQALSAAGGLAAVPAGDLEPRDEAELAAILRDAADPVAVVGNGSKAGMLRPVQAATTLSARALSGVTLYAPKELIVSARAGTPLSAVEAVLAEAGQHLIGEPPDYAGLLGGEAPQTVGGMVAANLSGPRRVAWGATRDHVMGVRAVNGTGEVIRSGGRVLKNVTGLDLCKLLTGSHGTLAVLSEVTLKVLPVPERTATLALSGLDPARGVAALAAGLGSPFGVSGAAYLPAVAAAAIPALAWLPGSVTLIRIEDFATSVAYRSAKLRDDLRAFGAAEIIDHGGSLSAWRAVRDAVPMADAEAGSAIWRVSVRPSAGPGVIRALGAVASRWFMDWGGGLVWVNGPASAAAHAAVMEAATKAGGVWTLMRAPASLRAAVDVVPAEAAPLARITRRVKHAFDPRGILNPGRIYAGL